MEAFNRLLERGSKLGAFPRLRSRRLDASYGFTRFEKDKASALIAGAIYAVREIPRSLGHADRNGFHDKSDYQIVRHLGYGARFSVCSETLHQSVEVL